MEKNPQTPLRKRGNVVVDEVAMSRYDNVVLFPEKLSRVNEMLKTAKLPPRKA